MTMSIKTRVLYNGDCPVCDFEISSYRKYAEAQKLPLRFDDLTCTDLGQWGIDADTAARRLHVLHQGQLYAGIDAFVLLWQDMPRYRWLAGCVNARPVYPLCVFLYDRIAAPILYRMHLRRMKRNRQR